MTAIAFSENWNKQVLCCPQCGGDYLHQGKLEVFQRGKEDGPSASITIEAGSPPRPSTGGRNPSSRRQWPLLYFSCEFCGSLPVVLAIAQHKGTTAIGWVKP